MLFRVAPLLGSMLKSQTNLLIINCGSSSLKCKLFELDSLNRITNSPLAIFSVTGIGRSASLRIEINGQIKQEQKLSKSSHIEAATLILDEISKIGVQVIAIGHRIVHGGDSFRDTTKITAQVIDELEKLNPLASLHNPIAIQVIEEFQKAYGESIDHFAVFDTSFHQSMPKLAQLYALPQQMSKKYNIKRFGFHGIAHQCMVQSYSKISGQGGNYRLITLQLGAGCSICAVKGGRSIDTSMGFTPLEGLVMATRSGDIDPSIPSYLSKQENISLDEVEKLLNHNSGLAGLFGESGDMREILKARGRGDPRAALAIDIFCYRIQKYIGAYAGVLGGVDGIVFGGGIGENSPQIREQILASFNWLGVKLDSDRNQNGLAEQGQPLEISCEQSKIKVFVARVDEEAFIAQEVAKMLD